MSPLDFLTREDAEILELERGHIAGHTVKVLVLERGPETPAVTLA